MTSKIQIGTQTVKTSTQRRFVVVSHRAETMFIVWADRGVRVAAGTDQTEVVARANAEKARRGIEGPMTISEVAPFITVAFRTDSIAKARARAAKEVGGVVFDTVVGEIV